MADLGTQETRGLASETAADSPLPFRFEISWHSLHGGKASPARISRASDAPIAIVERPRESLKERKPVLAPERRPPIVEPPPPEPVPQLVQQAVESPAFGMATDSRSLPKSRILVVLGVGAVLALGVTFTVGRGSSSASMGPAVTTEMGEAGWAAEWVSDRKGSALGRQLSLYRPSLGMSDYRLEFTGRILRNSLGWVFRVADTKNYYAVKVSEYGGRLALTRFAVIRGVEGPRTRTILPLLANAGVLKIRLDARHSQFTVYLQNQVVDDWQDDRLPTGSVGFLNERDEQGQIDSVQISFPKGVSDK